MDLAQLLATLKDKQFRSDVGQGVTDAANRGVIGGLLGGPVDLLTMAMRPLGYKTEKPVMGSEWIGDKLQSMGAVSGNRNMIAEGLAGVALPMGAARLAPKVFAAEQAMLKNAMAKGASGGVFGGQRGAINPKELGMMVNPDGTVSLYHGTTKQGAKGIVESGMLRSAGEPDVYLTTAKNAGYGDGSLVQVNADPRKLFLDDQFPDGRMDFRLPTKDGMARISGAKQVGRAAAPRQAALDTAQRNAVEMLGLPPNNTPMDRAKALGFDTETFHGTPNDGIARSRQFKDALLGKSTGASDAAMGHFTVKSGKAASEYTYHSGDMTGNVLPLMIKGKRLDAELPGEWSPKKYDAALKAAKEGGFDGLNINGATTLGTRGDVQVTFDPKNMRSRFASFDPARVNERDLLGRADVGLLGLLGLGSYGAAHLASDK
jgi:hypothetical protein